MIIKNGYVYTNEFRFEKKDLCFEGEYICKSCRGEELDAEGMYIIPGLIDLHFHGGGGASLIDGTVDAIRTIAEYEAKNGVTGICLSTEPMPHEKLIKALHVAAKFYAAQDKEHGAVLCGVNLEGPFLTHEKIGGNDAEYLKLPDEKTFEIYRSAAGGIIKIVDVAPDLEGSVEFIERESENVVISLAHTPAGYEASMRGFNAGAKLVTHLFNSMAAFHHRDTGLVGAAMDSGAYVELICDGLHVSDPMLRAAYKIFGADRIVCISDSLFCTGLADGSYKYSSYEVYVKNGLAFMEDGTICGASSNLFENMRHLVKAGIPQNDAIRMSTYNPAKVLEVLDVMGTLDFGKQANFVIMDKNMNISEVYVKGKKTES